MAIGLRYNRTNFKTDGLAHVPLDVYDPNKEIKPRYFRENVEDAQKMDMYCRTALGSDCSNHGTTTTLLYIDTPEGYFDAEHILEVNDGNGGHIWRKKMFADDELQLTNADLIAGSNVADYTALTLSTLTLFAVGENHSGGDYIPKVEKDQIITGNYAKAFNADDLPLSNTDSTVVKTVTDATETTLAVITDHNATTHTAGTQLIDDIVKNATLDSDEVFINESFGAEIYNGSMEIWGAGASNPPSGYTTVAGANIDRESTIVYHGDYSAKVTAILAAQGMAYSFDNYSDFANLFFTVVAKIYVTSGTVRVTIDDGTSTAHTDTTTTGSWETIYVTKSIGSATKLDITITAVGAGAVWYVDSITPTYGTIGKFGGTSAKHVDKKYSGELKNYVLPDASNFSVWDTVTASTTTPPAGWEWTGLGSKTFAANTSSKFGEYCNKVYMNTGNDSMYCAIGDITTVLDHLKGETVTFSCWIKRDTGISAEDWDFAIDDGVTTSSITITSADFTDWEQISVTHTVSNSATKLDLKVTRNVLASGNDNIYIDNVWLNKGSVPSRNSLDGSGDSASVWAKDVHTFDKNYSVLSDGYTFDGDHAPGKVCYPYMMTVTSVSPSGGVPAVTYTDFTLLKTDSETNLCVVAGADDTSLVTRVPVTTRKGKNWINYSQMETDKLTAALSSINVRVNYDNTPGVYASTPCVNVITYSFEG